MPECRVIFENKTPDYWQVTMVAIGAKFFYKRADGSIHREYQTSKAVNLSSNQSDVLNSDDASLCAGALFAAITVRQPNQPDKIMTKSDGTNPNECATEWRICIQPAGGTATYSSIEEALNSKEVEIDIRPMAAATQKS